MTTSTLTRTVPTFASSALASTPSRNMRRRRKRNAGMLSSMSPTARKALYAGAGLLVGALVTALVVRWIANRAVATWMSATHPAPSYTGLVPVGAVALLAGLGLGTYAIAKGTLPEPVLAVAGALMGAGAAAAFEGQDNRALTDAVSDVVDAQVRAAYGPLGAV